VAAEGEGDEPAEGEEPPPAPEEAGEGGTAAKPFEPVDVHVDVANMLLERWQVTESQFEQNMRRLLRAVRDEHRKGVNWIAQMRNSYMDMLRQPKAEKQKLVHAFQVMFNSIDMEVRQLEETKNELHERTDDLRNSLWEIADEQREAAEGERAEVMEDTYVADASSMLDLSDETTYRQLDDFLSYAKPNSGPSNPKVFNTQLKQGQLHCATVSRGQWDPEHTHRC
jgi:hypothetical protein